MRTIAEIFKELKKAKIKKKKEKKYINKKVK